jgi:hypothetical protein
MSGEECGETAFQISSDFRFWISFRSDKELLRQVVRAKYLGTLAGGASLVGKAIWINQWKPVLLEILLGNPKQEQISLSDRG